MKKTAPHNSRSRRVQKKTIVLGLLAAVFAGVMMVRSRTVMSPATVDFSSAVATLADLDLTGASREVQTKFSRQINRVTESPDDVDAWGQLGMALLIHQLNEPAVDCLRVASQLQPDEFRWQYLIGHSLMFMDPGQSAAAFEQAATMNPDYVPAQMLLVEVLMKAGRLEEAESRLSGQLPAEVGQHPWATWQRSRLAYLKGDFQFSLALAEEYYGNKHISREVLRHLLKVKRRTHPNADLSELKQELNDCKLETINWECPVLRYVYSKKVDHDAAIQTAQGFLNQGNVRGAMSVFQKALSTDPQSSELLFHLAEAWKQLGDVDRADAILQKAEHFEPNSFRIQIQRAKFAVAREQWKLAKLQVDKALSVKPDSADAYCILAVILQAEGNENSANEAVEKALWLDPQHSVANKLVADAGDK